MAKADSDTVTSPRLRHNEEVAWDLFAPDAYWRHNYGSLREDDRAIILAVGEYFSGYFEEHPRPRGAVGIDIGSGPNLYPALAMLPWVDEIILTDHSRANVEWLQKHLTAAAAERRDMTWEWQPFWDTYTTFPGYEPDADIRTEIGKRCRVEQQSVFQIGRGLYDMGTMFFVAESMTSYETEFEDATEHFLNTLAPDAPFAAAFMDKSLGYLVGDKSYPAVREVDLARVKSTLMLLGAKASVEKIPVPGNDPLRDGYDGMIIAVGTTRGPGSTGPA